MKKEVQKQINKIVEDFVNSLDYCLSYNDFKPLRSCKASVADVGNVYLLKSYNTIVAAIDKETDTLYDFSRMVYGYTATTSQHIAKFNHDYCNRVWGCDVVRTWKEVK